MTSPSKPSPRRVATALAMVEGRHLVTSPVFLAGLALALIGTGVFIKSLLGDGTATWSDDAWTMGVGFALTAIFVMVAVNRAALRDRRGHAVEQHDALPTPRPVRVAGLFAGALWLAVVTTVLLGIGVIFGATRLDVPGINAMYVIHNAALVLMLAAVGLALATWMPSPFVAPMVALAMYLIAPGETPARWHVVWPFATLETPVLVTWHIAYLLGLAVLFAAVASGRPNWGQAQTVCALVAGAVVAVSLAFLLGGECPLLGPCLI